MRILAIFVVCATLAQFAIAQGAGGTADTATAYLRAWAFKDYSTMFDLSATSAKQLSRETFYAAAASLGETAGDPQIVSRTRTQQGEVVYYQYQKPGANGPIRGSIIVQASGVEHPQLLAQLRAGSRVQNDSTSPAQVAPAVGRAEATPVSVAGETVDSVLQKMNQTSAATQSLTGEIAISGSLMGATMNETGTMAYKAPNKFRMNFKSFIMNADGTRNILYMPDAKMYMNVDQLGQFELTPGIGTTVEQLKQRYDVKLAGKSDIDGEPVFELLMTPPKNATAAVTGSDKMRIWVSANTWLPMRAKLSSMSVEYRNMRVNSNDVSDATFQFSPPAGTQELSLSGVLGMLGGGGNMPANPQF